MEKSDSESENEDQVMPIKGEGQKDDKAKKEKASKPRGTVITQTTMKFGSDRQSVVDQDMIKFKFAQALQKKFTNTTIDNPIIEEESKQDQKTVNQSFRTRK